MSSKPAFWDNVDKNGPVMPGMETPCWVWIGTTDGQGYGRFKHLLAHRLAWIEKHGVPPTDKPCVLHRCDNPPCVRPAHLFVGTRSDNAADKVAKGRQRCGRHPGEANPAAKLTTADAAEIRRRYAAGGIRQSDLALEYGVSRSAIGWLVRGEHWRTA